MLSVEKYNELLNMWENREITFDNLFRVVLEYNDLDFEKTYIDTREIVEREINGRDYWVQYVKDYIDCCDNTYDNFTDNDVKNVVDWLMNTDNLWAEIDNYLVNVLDDYKLNVKNKKNDK